METLVEGSVTLSGDFNRVEGQPDNWRFILLEVEDDDKEPVLWIFDTYNGKGVRPVPEGPIAPVLYFLSNENEAFDNAPVRGDTEGTDDTPSED